MSFPRTALLAAILLCVPFSLLSEEELSYTVRPGDTLEKVIEEFGTEGVSVEELRRYNNLKSVRRIPPGTKIRFQLGWLKIKPLQAVAAAVSGEARVIRAGREKAEEVREGDGFKPGDVLETGTDSSVLLKFGDGSRLLLQGNSALAFEVLEAYGDHDVPGIRIFLHRGRIETEIAPNESPDRRFEIRTPAGSAGARGTRFRVGSGADTLLTEVTHGTVAVAGSGGDGVLALEENFGTVVEAGRPPIPPVELLPPPGLDPVREFYRRMPLRIEWRGVPQAAGYRVQLRSASAADVILLDRISEGPRLEVRELDDGDYILRVRALDSYRLEGRDAERPFTLDAHPLPPPVVAPSAGQRFLLGRDEVVLRWEESPGAAGYQLQLARGEDFSHPLIQRAGLTGTSYLLAEPLSAGRYYWRIASRDAHGERGPFSRVFHFELAHPPEPPREIRIRKSAGELRIGWRKGRQGLRYHLQLAEDREFSRLLEERETDADGLTLPRPQGRSYLRIRSMDAWGNVSEFTTPLEIVAPVPGYIPAVVLGVLGLVLLL